jgi:hypothetical protein
VVTVTGRAWRGDDRISKGASRAAVESRGAQFTDEWSERVTLLVWGDFSSGKS